MSVSLAKTTTVLMQIQQLLLQMQQAMVAGHWLQVQDYDRQISSLVAQLKQGVPQQDLHIELQLIKQRYQSLVQLAKRQQKTLDQKMQRFQDTKTAVVAYQLTAEAGMEYKS
jgi:cell division FtsZ-interacting protein ZapD